MYRSLWGKEAWAGRKAYPLWVMKVKDSRFYIQGCGPREPSQKRLTCCMFYFNWAVMAQIKSTIIQLLLRPTFLVLFSTPKLWIKLIIMQLRRNLVQSKKEAMLRWRMPHQPNRWYLQNRSNWISWSKWGSNSKPLGKAFLCKYPEVLNQRMKILLWETFYSFSKESMDSIFNSLCWKIDMS